MPSLAGTYTCNASNVVSSIIKSTQLEVHTVPNILFPRNGLTIKESQYDAAVLECLALGIPQPNIHWLVLRSSKNVTLTTNEFFTILESLLSDSFHLSSGRGVVLAVNSTLVINETLDAHSGTYYCEAVSDAGSDSRQITLEVQVAANITEYPDPQLVTSPSTATFHCTASGLPRPSITWMNPNDMTLTNGMTLTDGGEIAIFTMNISTRILMSTLQVMKTSPSVSGTYTCSADNFIVGRDDVTSISNTLKVHVVPTITSHLPEGSPRYVVNVTDNITFQCTATGVPPPDIQWYRRGDLLNSSNDRIVIENLSIDEPSQALATVIRELTLTLTSTSDAGNNYSCRATNAATGGEDSEMFELFVQVPPMVFSLPRHEGNVKANVTVSFTLMNAVPSVDPVDIRWYYSSSRDIGVDNFNTGLLNDITNKTNRTKISNLIFSTNHLTSNLTIMNLVQAIGSITETDQGRYFLRVSNPAGIAVNFTDVIVAGPPQILTGPLDQIILNSSEALFHCVALGDPIPSLTWNFTSLVNSSYTRNLTSSFKYDISNSTNSTTLVVDSVNYNDYGFYTCEASNKVESVQQKGKLQVDVPPKVLNWITTDSTPLLHRNITLLCHISGNPLPQVVWQKNGKHFANGSNVNTSTFVANHNISYNGFDINPTIDPDMISVLKLDGVTRDITSNYSCMANIKLNDNEIYNDSSDYILVEVLEKPDPPVNLWAFDPEPMSFHVNWTSSFDGNRRHQYFVLNITSLNTASTAVTVKNFIVNDNQPPNTIYSQLIGSAENILPHTNYTISIKGCNMIGCSESSPPSNTILTQQYLSSPPLQLSWIERSMNEIQIQWDRPTTPNGIIVEYIVFFIGSKSYDQNFSHLGNNSLNCDQNNCLYTLQNLVSQTVYNITVAARNGAHLNNGIGNDSTVLKVATLSAPPPIPSIPSNINLMQRDELNPLIYKMPLPKFNEENGQISHYHIVVILLPDEFYKFSEMPDSQYKTIQDFGSYSPELCNQEITDPIAYIASEFDHEDLPETFIVGEGGPNSPNDRPSVYQNGLLCYSTSYTFFVRAYPISNQHLLSQRTKREAIERRQYTEFTSSGYYPIYTTESAPLDIYFLLMIGGIALAVVLLLILLCLICVLCCRAKRKNGSRSGYYEPNHELVKIDYEGYNTVAYSPPHQQALVREPIPVEVFSSHLETMHLNENCGFIEEYKVIQESAPKKPATEFAKDENRCRNRYMNIEAFDETRVQLRRVEGSAHDYVNANFIDGYNRPKEYIASQGPLEATVIDFWRTVWDHNVPTIVMLTNLVEKERDKCYQYWPDTEPETHGHLTVSVVNTVTLSDTVVRIFQVKNNITNEMKDVRQFHFISWPDHGVPRTATPLLFFLGKIRNYHKYDDSRPMIVHCSAGVGRTGTLITIDTELQRALKDKQVDAFNYVKQLRQQRNYMVQTDTQYVFLHDAVYEGIVSGKTEVVANQLNQYLNKLRELDEDEESGFRKEFQLLRLFKVNIAEFSDASSDHNKFKNRVTNAIPYNFNRVVLKMKPGIGGSDYINASFMDGYAKKSEFIAAQGPLSNTVEDFWRMIWESSISVIVMLTKLEEREEEVCSQYWPTSSDCPEKIGNFSIELVAENDCQDYTTRNMKLTLADSDEVREIHQFQFTSWPEQGVPTSGVGILDLIDQVTRKQRQTGDNPIVIHCSAGIGRTGVFCCLSTALDRVKAEGTVDVFFTIKHLRTQRPRMVQSEDQYIFCYQTLLEYVNSLSNYSNFQ